MEDRKPTVLVLGGCGFIGRNLVHYLIQNNLASKVRVADKMLPGLAWMNKTHQEAFKHVEFKQANLINSVNVEKAFRKDGGPFDYVINCAGETKFGQTAPVYQDGIVKLSTSCAREAAKQGVKRYIEISSAHVHSSDKHPITEDCSLDPWTQHAVYKLKVEQELRSMSNLDYVIVRPALIYGPSDRAGITPRLVIGRVYKYLDEKMQMLWNKNLKVNTVHVRDVCRALWHLCQNGQKGHVYNLCDKGDTTQGVISSIVSDLFNINHDYLGNVFSQIAKISMAEVVDDINQKHMSPWVDLCQRHKIASTPLTPFIHQELLLNKHLYVNGTKIESTGFRYEVPQMNKELLQEVLDDYVALKLFP